MSKKSKPTIVSIDGKRKQSKDGAMLELEGERINLESFVLSGEDVNGKRVLFTWNCSPDEMCAFSKTLDALVSKRLTEIMDIE
jgi:hypothetical protein